MAEAAPTTGEWGRFRGVRSGWGITHGATHVRGKRLTRVNECVRGPVNRVCVNGAMVCDTRRSRCNPGDTEWEDTDLSIPMRYSRGVARLLQQLNRLIRRAN